jgi:hypothetical protein
MKLLAEAAIITAIASPAMAVGPHARSEAVQQRQHEARVYRHYRSGFWPGDVAAGVLRGAIGTAGTIAGAPFGYYDDDYYGVPYPYAW